MRGRAEVARQPHKLEVAGSIPASATIKMFEMIKVKPEEIDKFVHDHIQSKIDHDELPLVGFDMEDDEAFTKQFEIYKLALFEGIMNGILWCGGEIEGIRTSE